MAPVCYLCSLSCLSSCDFRRLSLRWYAALTWESRLLSLALFMVILVVSQHEASGNWEIVSYKRSPTGDQSSQRPKHKTVSRKSWIWDGNSDIFQTWPIVVTISFTALVRSFQFWLLTNRYWNWKLKNRILVSWFTSRPPWLTAENATANDLPIMMLCFKKRWRLLKGNAWTITYGRSIPGGPWVCCFLATPQTDSRFSVLRCFDQ